MPSSSGKATNWKILLALLVGAFAVGMVISFFLAADRGSGVADRDYYSHGLRYGRTAAGSINPGLDWKISASVAGADLQVRVSDRSGTPVAGGELRFQPEQLGASAGEPLPLAESAPGIFKAPRPAAPEGELHGTLRFTRGEAFATQKLVLFN
jgi:hypothetical protein